MNTTSMCLLSGSWYDDVFTGVATYDTLLSGDGIEHAIAGRVRRAEAHLFLRYGF